MFLEALAQAAKEKCGLTRERPILVGVSGGADSLALMRGLERIGFNLTIAHLDHALRPESAEDADYVQNLAESRGLPFVRARIDVRQKAAEAGQSLEEAARHVRYCFLFEQAQAQSAQAVAVGHHADDQVETVLMHFVRGAALPGLSGMAYRRVFPQWDKDIPLVRPLLGIWRDEIHDFLLEVGLEPRLDVSNRDVTFFRNRLRHELIPELETYNPQVKNVIWRMADVVGDEDQFLEGLTEEAWESCLFAQTAERIELRRPTFLKLPKPIMRRVFRRAISQLRPDLRDVGYEAIERGLAFAEAPSEGGEIDLVARLNLAVIKDALMIKTWTADLPDWDKPLLPSESTHLKLDVGEAVELCHGWAIQAELISEAPENALNLVGEMDSNEAWLDFGDLKMPLILRGRRPGERWQPLGMEAHTQKLQDFFINEKVLAHLRDLWPLVCSGGQVAWVVGLRPSERFKITPQTRRICRLKLFQKNQK